MNAICFAAYIELLSMQRIAHHKKSPCEVMTSRVFSLATWCLALQTIKKLGLCRAYCIGHLLGYDFQSV